MGTHPKIDKIIEDLRKCPTGRGQRNIQVLKAAWGAGKCAQEIEDPDIESIADSLLNAAPVGPGFPCSEARGVIARTLRRALADSRTGAPFAVPGKPKLAGAREIYVGLDRLSSQSTPAAIVRAYLERRIGAGCWKGLDARVWTSADRPDWMAWDPATYPLVVPMYDSDGWVRGLKFRAIEPGVTPKSMSPAGWGISGLTFGSPGPRVTLYVEGEMDWLAATAVAPAGMAVCGLIGSSVTEDGVPAKITSHVGGTAILALDADYVGAGIAAKLSNILDKNGTLIQEVTYPSGSKDICDVIAAGDADITKLLRTARATGMVGAATECHTASLTSPYIEYLKSRAGAGGPLTTGISTLDTALGGGLMLGCCSVLSGGVGSGKTSLSLGIALHTAHLGKPAVYLSLEESERAVLDKLVRIMAPKECPVTSLSIQKGERCAVELATAVCPDLDALPLVIAGYHARFAGTPVEDAAGYCVAACRHLFGQGPVLLIVDFIQQAALGGADARGALNVTIQGLNTLADKGGLHCMILSQQQRSNRDTSHIMAGRREGELNWAAIRESSQETSRLEQLASQMLVIIREVDLAGKVQSSAPWCERKRIAIPKNRLARAMQVVELDFLGRSLRWGYSGEYWSTESSKASGRKDEPSY